MWTVWKAPATLSSISLARAGGVDGKLMVEALTPGAGGSWALEKLGPRIAGGDFAPGFMVKLIQKDLRIVQSLAHAGGLPLEGTALAQRYFADNDVWYQSVLAGARANAQLAETARQGVAILGRDTPAAARLENIARFVGFVGESIARAAEQAREILYAKPEVRD